jgi:hypothetical protein
MVYRIAASGRSGQYRIEIDMGDLWKVRSIDSWQSFVGIRDTLNSESSNARWIFRGQADTSWSVRSRFERFKEQFGKVNLSPLNAREAERDILREFKRHFHRYNHRQPFKNDNLEWLSIMQHYGAPTRMVDWTFSEFIALFFAINDAAPESRCAVFAVNQRKLWESLKARVDGSCSARLDRNDKDAVATNAILLLDGMLMAALLNPMRLTRRLNVQQGTFLVPISVEHTFEQNLMESAEIGDVECWKFEISCSPLFLRDAFIVLDRFNVSDVSLFPGIDGSHAQ